MIQVKAAMASLGALGVVGAGVAGVFFLQHQNPSTKTGDVCKAESITKGHILHDGFLNGYTFSGYYLGQSLKSARIVAKAQGHREIPYIQNTNGVDWSNVFQGETVNSRPYRHDILPKLLNSHKVNYIKISASGTTDPVVSNIEISVHDDDEYRDYFNLKLHSEIGNPTWSYDTSGDCIHEHIDAYGSSNNLLRPNQISSANCFALISSSGRVSCLDSDKPSKQWLAISKFDHGFNMTVSTGIGVN